MYKMRCARHDREGLWRKNSWRVVVGPSAEDRARSLEISAAIRELQLGFAKHRVPVISVYSALRSFRAGRATGVAKSWQRWRKKLLGNRGVVVDVLLAKGSTRLPRRTLNSDEKIAGNSLRALTNPHSCSMTRGLVNNKTERTVSDGRSSASECWLNRVIDKGILGYSKLQVIVLCAVTWRAAFDRA